MRPFLFGSSAPTLHSLARHAVRGVAVLASLAGVFFCLTGCGLGTPALNTPASSSVSAGSFSGKIFGGPNPIIGATVKAYTTGNSDGSNGGYGVTTFRQEATAVSNPAGYPSGDTDMGGGFSFAGGYTCPTGQFLYLVSAGGNTGASTSANGATATAALGGGDGSGVSAITVTAAGSGYLSATVTITSADGPGSGAAATAQVTNGMVTGIAVTAPGSGYDVAPNVVISAPTNTNGANNNAVLVAALGRCDDVFKGGVYTGGGVIMNELTTISAAYALGHFSTESGSGSSTVVSIGAPATNNAAEVSGVSTGCVAGDPVEGNSSATCAATASAGLAHAFLNAANLVNYSPTAGPLSGAYLNPPSNPTAIAPQALVNTIGNILVACVNSSGGVANDGSACGSIFQDTTSGASIPVDTFGAMVNLAANPTMSGSTAAVDNFFNLAAPFTNVYSPFLASSTGLNDYSLAIDYPAGTGAVSGAQGITYPNTAALDMNDVYFIGNQSTSSGGAPVNIVALASNGAVLGASPNDTTLKYEYGLSVDALGNGYFGNGNGSSSNAMGHFTAVGGVPATDGIIADTTLKSGATKIYVYSTAVDQHNNVWTLASGSADTVLEGTPGAGFFNSIANPTITLNGNFTDIAIDPDQNVWAVAGTALNVIPNNGTLTGPTYTASLINATTDGNPAIGLTFVGTPPFAAANPYVAYISYYKTGTAGVEPYTPALTGTQVTGVSTTGLQTNAEYTGSYYDEADGAGVIWTAGVNDKAIIYFVPGATPTAYRYIPCLVTSGACGSIFGGNKPFDVSIDSTGSIWTPVAASGSVVQIIGAAAPTVPLLSLGLTGKP